MVRIQNMHLTCCNPRRHSMETSLCSCVAREELFPSSVNQLSQKSMNLSEAFLRFVLELPTPELKCHPRAIRCQFVCFHYSGNNTLVVCQPTRGICRAPNLFICGGEGQANTAASEIDVLYLRSMFCVHCPALRASIFQRKLVFQCACWSRTHAK